MIQHLVTLLLSALFRHQMLKLSCSDLVRLNKKVHHHLKVTVELSLHQSLPSSSSSLCVALNRLNMEKVSYLVSAHGSEFCNPEILAMFEVTHTA